MLIVMRRNWSFGAGVALFVAQGLAVPTGSPFIIGSAGIACIACLLAGFFRYAMSEIGITRLLLYAAATAILILMAGRLLFLAVEGLTYDTSADVYVGYVVLGAWAGTIAVLIYGIIHRIRSPRGA